MPTVSTSRLNTTIHTNESIDPEQLTMPIPTPAGALSVTFRVLCLRCPGARLRLVSLELKLPWFLDEEYRALIATEATIPLVAAEVAAAASEANRVALMAAQSVPKFRSVVERDSYEELRTTHAAIEQIRLSLRRLRTEQGSMLALLGEVVASLGRLPAVAVTVTVPDRTGGRRKRGKEEGTIGAGYGEGENGE
ncbi:hypothetical protein GMDG_00558 [Pseudogymnoascus destructans 20631-21]|uniref:Uncharacterized protein n=1 Tax=Pseudogymnoascus destructans (strain ATCC MYA-4855 / 20631-21) TaxID=658429 RepID=L8G6L9_PSED2|nr:hypothetical protein GMDG_00558 [Pseudogymnoascus destructans 20631-21]